MAHEGMLHDKSFFEELQDNVKHFLVNGILPELVGKWYTRIPVADEHAILAIPIVSPILMKMTTRRIMKRYGAVVAMLNDTM